MSMNDQSHHMTLEHGAGLIEYMPLIVIITILAVSLVVAVNGQALLGLSIFFGIILLVGSWIGGWILFYRWRTRKHVDDDNDLLQAP